jgi:hypothetical protein
MRKWVGWSRGLLLLVAATAAGIAANLALLAAAGGSGDAVGRFNTRLVPSTAVTMATVRPVHRTKRSSEKPRRLQKTSSGSTATPAKTAAGYHDDSARAGSETTESDDD